MNLTIVLEGLQEDLQGLAELGDERSAQIARRLGDALNSKLPSGHIEVRLAGQEPELVFVDAPGESAGPVGEELSARISLRLPESLKTAVEKASDAEGISTNAWLIRAIARATESRPVHVSGKRLSGYAQS